MQGQMLTVIVLLWKAFNFKLVLLHGMCLFTHKKPSRMYIYMFVSDAGCCNPCGNPIAEHLCNLLLMLYAQARTDAFAALEEAMQRQDVAAGVPSHLDRLVTIFLENISATSSTNHSHKISCMLMYCHCHSTCCLHCFLVAHQ